MSAGRERWQSYIEFPGTDIRIPVPDDPDGEDEAVAAAFDELVASGRWKRDDGPPIPAEELYKEFGYTPPAKRRRGRRPGAGGDFRGRLLVRVPASVHQELAARAARERTTINQLVLSYISRGLGHDSAADHPRTAP
jgi:hypothetical protein